MANARMGALRSKGRKTKLRFGEGFVGELQLAGNSTAHDIRSVTSILCSEFRGTVAENTSENHVRPARRIGAIAGDDE